MKFEVSPDLDDLLSLLLDWSAPAIGAEIFLFGSRVRGDHHATSDVDISIKWASPSHDQTTDWWDAQNTELFRAINARLPGPLHLPIQTDTERDALLRNGEIVFTRGNIHCVWIKGEAVIRKGVPTTDCALEVTPLSSSGAFLQIRDTAYHFPFGHEEPL